MVDLHGRVAIVTGASRGVGKGIALGLGEAGAPVYVIGRTVDDSRLPPFLREQRFHRALRRSLFEEGSESPTPATWATTLRWRSSFKGSPGSRDGSISW